MVQECVGDGTALEEERYGLVTLISQGKEV